MSIHRYTDRDLRVQGPLYCFECNNNKQSGYWLFHERNIGPQAVFVCDDCLAKARKVKFFDHARQPDVSDSV